MERLTKTYSDGTHGAADNLTCGENSYAYKQLLLDSLVKYEDLEEQRLLLKVPHNDKFNLEHSQEVYLIDGSEIIKCIHLGLDGNFDMKLASYKDIFQYRSSDLKHGLDPVDFSKITKTVPDDEFGKTVFLTREEAEDKLKEMEESHD